MDNGSNRRWLILAGAVLLFMIGLWILAVLQLKPAAAGGNRISLSLRSRLAANYDPNAGQSLGSLSLSIVSDVMEDLGMGSLEAESYSDAMRVAMLTPVPTATALNFEGDPPPTLTPTKTKKPIPTDTPTATPTATNTRRPPTRTPTPKPTEKPAATAKPAEPTAVCSDCKNPQIKGAVLAPSGGDTGLCSSVEVVTITDLHIVDPSPSSGMNWVGVKYKFSVSGANYVYVELSQTGGGWTSGPGSSWDAKYGGTVSLDWDKRFGSILQGGRYLAKPVARQGALESSTETPTPGPTKTSTPTVHTIRIWAKAEDNAGNVSHFELASYTCAE